MMLGARAYTRRHWRNRLEASRGSNTLSGSVGVASSVHTASGVGGGSGRGGYEVGAGALQEQQRSKRTALATPEQGSTERQVTGAELPLLTAATGAAAAWHQPWAFRSLAFWQRMQSTSIARVCTQPLSGALSSTERTCPITTAAGQGQRAGMFSKQQHAASPWPMPMAAAQGVLAAGSPLPDCLACHYLPLRWPGRRH